MLNWKNRFFLPHTGLQKFEISHWRLKAIRTLCIAIVFKYKSVKGYYR